MRDYDQVIKLTPKEADAYHARAIVYSLQGDLDHAISELDQAIKIKSNYADAYITRGFAHQLLGNKENAIADFMKVLDLTNNPTLRHIATQQLKELGTK